MKFFGTERFEKNGNKVRIAWVFCLPFFTRIRHLNEVVFGGVAQDFVHYEYRLLGVRIHKGRQVAELSKIFKFWQGDHTHNDLCKYITETPDIANKIRALSEGLDTKSKETLFKILGRLKNYVENPKVPHRLTSEEITELGRIHTEFLPNIIKLDENVWGYNGYFLPIDCFSASVFWHRHSLDSFAPQTLESMRHKDIIDVGGFIGDSTLILKDFTDKKIHSFEATSENYNLMLQTIQLNNLVRVVPVKMGLGARAERIKISLCSSASSAAFEIGDEFEECEIITLDSYVRENGLEVGFIKVDIEGFEMEFIKGALETIKTQRPAMLISIYHKGSDFFEIKPYLESLNLGYSFKIVKPIDSSVSVETALFCEVLE